MEWEAFKSQTINFECEKSCKFAFLKIIYRIDRCGLVTLFVISVVHISFELTQRTINHIHFTIFHQITCVWLWNYFRISSRQNWLVVGNDHASRYNWIGWDLIWFIQCWLFHFNFKLWLFIEIEFITPIFMTVCGVDGRTTLARRKKRRACDEWKNDKTEWKESNGKKKRRKTENISEWMKCWWIWNIHKAHTRESPKKDRLNF